MRHIRFVAGLFAVAGLIFSAGASGNAPDPKAVEEVASGARTEANAAWWGFNEEDSTDALQAAINSGAKRVVIPNMTKEWIVRPITLAGNQEIVLEPGAAVVAKRGEFRGKGDSLFRASNIENLTIRGYGAKLRMQKEDYIVGDVIHRMGWERWFGQYEKAEWRSGLSLNGCSNVVVEGLTICDTGGDGIYVAGGKEKRPCKNIVLRDVVCDNNYRQGISVISVDGLTVENCAFKNTWGTPPSAGVDIEPDSAHEMVKDIVFRNCSFTDNYGDGIEVFLAHQKLDSKPTSILFENCRVSSMRGAGIRVTKIGDNGPEGSVVFRNCTVENTEAYGIKVQDKSLKRASVKFIHCTVRNAANNRQSAGAWAPIWLHLFRENVTKHFGGIVFDSCVVEDDHDRPFMVYEQTEGDCGVTAVSGTITVRNPYGAKTSLGGKQKDVTLKVEELR
ncbi:MAG: right-handed parallel beta-helix repeat-containing protein [Candidatus Hydrogenedentes bacterium]|nr:right-handed parallel beta-helix repeat-containing protein [Candidatus Hydrogenedentota bacterium]